MTRILLVVLLALPQCLLANPVQFDIPQLAPATTVPVGQIAPRLPESLHVRLQLDISTLVASGFSGRVEEATIKILAHRPLVQVADFWPRTEMVSQYSSMISVSEEQDRLKQASINAIGGYPGVGSAKAKHTSTTISIATFSISKLRQCSCSAPPALCIAARVSTSSFDRRRK